MSSSREVGGFSRACYYDVDLLISMRAPTFGYAVGRNDVIIRQHYNERDFGSETRHRRLAQDFGIRVILITNRKHRITSRRIQVRSHPESADFRALRALVATGSEASPILRDDDRKSLCRCYLNKSGNENVPAARHVCVAQLLQAIV
jgi:hypothetical protein